MRMINYLALGVLTSALGLTHAALAEPEYRVTIVGPPGSVATAINNAGAVAGNHAGNVMGSRAFVNWGRGWVDLRVPGAASARVAALNNRGQVLGNWNAVGGMARGVIWHKGRARDLGIVPGMLATIHTDINDAGYVTVYARQEEAFSSYLRAANGSLRALGSLPVDNPITEAVAINNRNQITGGSGEFVFPELQYRAFLWSRGAMRELVGFGALPTRGLDINDRGQVTGFASIPFDPPLRVAYIHSNGRFLDIDSSPPEGRRYSIGESINNRGHVVGESTYYGTFVYRGWRMESIDALLDPAPGWRIGTPARINDAGQIAANGVRNGVQYAVRLDPIRPGGEALLPTQSSTETTPQVPDYPDVDAPPDLDAAAREMAQPVQQ